jgi:hypothetical protein
VPDTAQELDLVALEGHPGAAAVPQPAAGQLVRDVVGRQPDARGTASTIPVRAGPWDSPAVSQRNMPTVSQT